MNTLKKFLWLLPLLGLLYMYANQEVVFYLGSPEHHDILASLGFSAGITTLLTWLVVPIEIGIIAGLLFFPSARWFLIAGLWTWVPRIISAIGGIENEIMESLAVSVLALLSYLAYKRGHYIPAKKLFAKR